MNRNTPGPTEIQVRAMAAILAHPQVWQLKHAELFAVASAATNGEALRGRVLGTMEKIRTERRLMGAENTPGGTEIHNLPWVRYCLTLKCGSWATSKCTKLRTKPPTTGRSGGELRARLTP